MNRLKFYNSFEGAENDRLKQIVNQDPIERLRNTVELILRVYGVTRDQLNSRPVNNRIKIISDGKIS